MFVQELKDILQTPLFDSHDNLSWLERAGLSYRRFQVLNNRLNITQDDVLNYSPKLRALHEWVGSIDGTLMTIMSIHYNLCMGTILRLGQKTPHINQILEELESLKSFGVYLGTELGYGNNLFNLQTTAYYDPIDRTFKLTTQSTEAKKFMPNTGHPKIPKIAVVFARLISLDKDCGIFPFIVRIRYQDGELCSGVHVTLLGEKPGYHLDNAITSFSEVILPKEFALLGSENFLDDDGTFRSNIKSKRARFLGAIDAVQAGKLSFTGAITTGAFVGCKIAYNYSLQKRTFAPGQEDVPLLVYNNQKRDIYTALAKAQAIQSIYDAALKIYAIDPISRRDEKTKYCNLAKYFSSSVGQTVFIKLRERIGAHGMFCNNRIIEYLNYVFGIVSAEGDNQILQLKVAKDLLLSQTWSRKMITAPFRLRKSLMNIDVCYKLIWYREKKLCRDIKTSFLVGKLKKKKTFEIWNSEVNRCLELGEVHAHRLVYKEMRKSRSAPQGISEDLHKRLCHLAMLDYIEKHLGWYVSKGLISSRQVQRWSHFINGILKEMDGPMAEAMHAIDAPVEVLRSPMLKKSLFEAFAEY